MFIRYSLILTSLVIAVLMTGCCCGPYGGCGYGGGCGGGGCVTDCNDCSGVTYGRSPLLTCGPLQHLTSLRKSLVCGGGCGEVYYGEWQSTPPDACDPCCNNQFVGGAVPCRPFCWQWRPGMLLYGFLNNVYGQRLCYGCGNNFNACGCSDGYGGSYDVGYSGEIIDGGYGGGCSTCSSATVVQPNTRIASPQPNTRIASPQPVATDHRTARANAIRRGVSSSSNRTRYR